MAESIQYGRCVNKARCSLAFNRETIFVPLDGNCPECGQPLQVDSMTRRRLKLVPLILVIALLGAGGYYAKTRFIDPARGKAMMPGGSSAGGMMTSPSGNSISGMSEPGMDSPTPPPAAAGDEPRAGAVDKPNFALENEANARARHDVLARIDMMPHLTADQKSKLLTAVDRARSMGCIFVIPFEAGKRTLGPRETDILINGFKSAAIKPLIDDPTLVFVILGYADTQGDPKVNEKMSIDRAQNVLEILRDKCGVQNVTYGVGMGGSSLFDSKSAAKNRLVEVFAVFP